MAQPTTRTTFKDYCKRKLGWPVVDLNLDDDQVEDCVDDALQFFQEYHFDATENIYLKHQITGSTVTLAGAPTGTFTDGEKITGGTSGVQAIPQLDLRIQKLNLVVMVIRIIVILQQHFQQVKL